MTFWTTMAAALPDRRRPRLEFPSFVRPVLKALLLPLHAAGAAVIALDRPGGKPVRLCATRPPPSALFGAGALFQAGSGVIAHGLDGDGNPILAGPWQMLPTRLVVLAFWREAGSHAWRKSDHRLVETASAALGAVLKTGAPPTREKALQTVADAVTGLPRARKFVADLPRHFARLDREGLPGTMILVSIDDFSQLRTRLGRKGIDEVLRQTAVLLNRVSRPTDVVARLDDNEFAIWLNGADHFTAAERAEQLREDAPGALTKASRGLPVSLSVGIAARRCGSPEMVNVLLQRADFAMHEAKKAGPGLWRVSQEEVG
jgi:diguanylate cyclase (GGDEF)-like protein